MLNYQGYIEFLQKRVDSDKWSLNLVSQAQIERSNCGWLEESPRHHQKSPEVNHHFGPSIQPLFGTSEVQSPTENIWKSVKPWKFLMGKP